MTLLVANVLLILISIMPCFVNCIAMYYLRNLGFSCVYHYHYISTAFSNVNFSIQVSAGGWGVMKTGFCYAKL